MTNTKRRFKLPFSPLLVKRIDKENGSIANELIADASFRIARFNGATDEDYLNKTMSIMSKLVDGETFETDFAIYKF
jgi:hypothetical protein